MAATGRAACTVSPNILRRRRARSHQDYYFGGSYAAAGRSRPCLLPEPLKLAGGLRILVHGDPTFMVMDNLKRQFEQVIGTEIHQRAFSIDRLREEGLRNAERDAAATTSSPSICPGSGNSPKAGVLRPLDEVMDVARLDPADFHTAGWKATHWGGAPMACRRRQRRNCCSIAATCSPRPGSSRPRDGRSDARARALHDPRRGRSRHRLERGAGTALGHTVLMTMADFGQPVLDTPEIAGGFDTRNLASRGVPPDNRHPAGLRAAEFLMELFAVRRPKSCRCPGTSGCVPMPTGPSRWPMATRCSRRISSLT